MTSLEKKEFLDRIEDILVMIITLLVGGERAFYFEYRGWKKEVV